MNEEVVKLLLDKINKKPTDIAFHKLLERKAITWYEVFYSICNEGQDAYKVLGFTESKPVGNKLKPYFDKKNRNEKWFIAVLRSINSKRCFKCREVKANSDFYSDNLCKECSAIKSSKYKLNNTKKIKEYNKEYYKEK